MMAVLVFDGVNLVGQKLGVVSGCLLALFYRPFFFLQKHLNFVILDEFPRRKRSCSTSSTSSENSVFFCFFSRRFLWGGGGGCFIAKISVPVIDETYMTELHL